MVQSRRLELPLRLKNSDLKAARLPIPPRGQRHTKSDTYVNSCVSVHTVGSACQSTTNLSMCANVDQMCDKVITVWWALGLKYVSSRLSRYCTKCFNFFEINMLGPIEFIDK